MLKPRPRRILNSRALDQQIRHTRKVATLTAKVAKHKADVLPDFESLVTPLPEVGRRYIPAIMAERSLHASVRHTSLYKRKTCKKWGRR